MLSQQLPDGIFRTLVGAYETYFAIMVVVMFIPTAIAWWKVHEKAGRPGWTGIVPFYNLWVLADIVDAPKWQAVLMMFTYTAVPGSLLLMPDMAEVFGRPRWLGYLSAFFPPLIFLVIAFSDATYQRGRSAAS